jgi:methionine salvage enolase-phosphatase E1
LRKTEERRKKKEDKQEQRSKKERMSLESAIALAALAVAVVAYVVARRSSRQVKQLSEMYWQLKYEHGELKSHVAPPPVDAATPRQTFVPLSDLKRP